MTSKSKSLISNRQRFSFFDRFGGKVVAVMRRNQYSVRFDDGEFMRYFQANRMRPYKPLTSGDKVHETFENYNGDATVMEVGANGKINVSYPRTGTKFVNYEDIARTE